ncbi:site-specific integrase [Sphingorhabdus sp.]|uniref:site-specific integrase n=1 Tax=Sphingorhabdus sp. TaxID=1902408 RepID=UPI0025D6EEBB|nr:site-specific integrase [Sphingorhabdus sp.]
MIKTTQMTTNDVRKLVQDIFVNVIAEQEAVGAYVAQTDQIDDEMREQLFMSQDRIADLRNQIALTKFDGEVRYHLRNLLTRNGFGQDELSQARIDDIANGVARALIEQQRFFQLRIDDRLAHFSPADSLFVSAALGVTEQGVLPTFKGPQLGDAVEKYLSVYRSVWKLKTYKARVWQLGYLVEFLGAQRPIESIQPSDIRNYRDALLTLRANHGFAASQSFAAKQTANANARIKLKTVELIFQPIKTFLKWAVSVEGLIEVNPAQSIKVVVKKEKTFVRVRRSFVKSDLERLFSCPLFIGCLSPHRRFVVGGKVFRDAKYWLPILGYLTGARLGELVQLAIGDVRVEDGISYIDINEKALVGVETKSVKSGAGHRRVPLHPDLLSLGFMEFVAKRAKQDKADVRLFKDVPFGVDGQASTEYSKIFGRLMDKVGLTDPQLVFHSFRHTAEDALRDAGCQPYVIDRIIGHADNTMGGKYGSGVSLSVLAEAVASMKLPVRLPSLLPTAKKD